MNGNDPGIKTLIELLDPRKKYLVNFSPFIINQIPVELVNEMVLKRNRTILYVCIGRPHVFVQKILKKKGVSPLSIYFMDMILEEEKDKKTNEISGSKAYGSERKRGLSIKFKLFRDDQEITEMDLDGVDLMIIDNLSELRTYKSSDEIESFLGAFNRIVDLKNKGLIMLHLNDRPGDGIPEIARSLEAEIIELSSEAFS